MKDILFELENSAKSDEYGREILTQSLFLQFMVYLNRIFLEKQYIFDKKSYTFDSQIASILQYINHNLKEDLSVRNAFCQILCKQVPSDAEVQTRNRLYPS